MPFEGTAAALTRASFRSGANPRATRATLLYVGTPAIDGSFRSTNGRMFKDRSPTETGDGPARGGGGIVVAI